MTDPTGSPVDDVLEADVALVQRLMGRSLATRAAGGGDAEGGGARVGAVPLIQRRAP